jgi:3-deoxy-D-manno-octulosonic-acid transferase
VAALISGSGSGLMLRRRSEWDTQPPADALTADVWLGDSMGEMPLYYACADVALLGGSFGPFGGQNLIEAAACGCPLVMGPHTYNFSQAAELALQAGSALRVAGIDEGVARAVALARDASRDGWVQGALAFAAAHRGAAERMAREILALADRRPSRSPIA